jgi:hypothetical protein
MNIFEFVLKRQPRIRHHAITADPLFHVRIVGSLLTPELIKALTGIQVTGQSAPEDPSSTPTEPPNSSALMSNLREPSRRWHSPVFAAVRLSRDGSCDGIPSSTALKPQIR